MIPNFKYRLKSQLDPTCQTQTHTLLTYVEEFRWPNHNLSLVKSKRKQLRRKIHCGMELLSFAINVMVVKL